MEDELRAQQVKLAETRTVASPDRLRAAEEARSRAEQSKRAVEDLVAWVSHELRTPVASIGGYADILALGLRGALTADQQLILERIQQAQAHLVTLLEDLLTFTRADVGQLQLEMAATPLTPILDRLISILAPQAAQRQITLNVTADDAVAYADAERMLQILLNLVGNALKFTPTAGRVDVTCCQRNNCVEVRVRDSGPGVPPHAREQILQPYVRLAVPTSSRVAGAGLGLAISRQLARAMNGDLSCVDGEGAGSVFVLRLQNA